MTILPFFALAAFAEPQLAEFFADDVCVLDARSR